MQVLVVTHPCGRSHEQWRQLPNPAGFGRQDALDVLGRHDDSLKCETVLPGPTVNLDQELGDRLEVDIEPLASTA